MATVDVNVNALPSLSAAPSATDSVVMVGRTLNDGKLIDYNLLADLIIAKWKTTTFSDLTTTAKTVTSAINEVDADLDTKATISLLEAEVAKREVLVIDCGRITSLPLTIPTSEDDHRADDVEDDMVCIQSTLGTPSAQSGDWTVTTGTGTLTISGQIGAISTTLVIYLMKSRTTTT